MSVAPWELLAGVGLDLLVGDPRWFPHPVRGFGWLAKRLERLWRGTRIPLRLAGGLFWITACGSATLIVSVTLPWAAIFWIWALLALRDLDVEATRVLRELDAGNLTGAQQKLSLIVGRDTAELDEAGIIRAVVETVAENLNDAVIAPLFFLALGGVPAMAAYKAANTLDSMVGYRSEKYREFGWASARLDDVANFLPARLSALLIWCCALLLGYDARRSVCVTLRDASSQPSPNAGYPEAAVAGALGIRLGGLNYYQGVPSRKCYLGDPVSPLTRGKFTQVRKLLYGTAALMTLAVCGARS